MANLKGGYQIFEIDIQKYGITTEEPKQLSIIENPELKEIYEYILNSHSIRKPLLIQIIDRDASNVTAFANTLYQHAEILSSDGSVLVLSLGDTNILTVEYHEY